MSYITWAVLYEGDTDASYFDVLIPRILEELAFAGPSLPTIPLTPAIRFKRAGAAQVAEEACAAADSFHLVFIHADTGGRGLQAGLAQRGTAYCEAMRDLCQWPMDRCIVIAPRHETEAWVLADPSAVTGTLGYTGTPNSIGLPHDGAAAERLVDPKATLANAIAQVRGRRRVIRPDELFPAIAQRQSLAALRALQSFQNFEGAVDAALNDLGVL